MLVLVDDRQVDDLEEELLLTTRTEVTYNTGCPCGVCRYASAQASLRSSSAG